MYVIISNTCNCVNRISIDQISFSVALIHSYSDHKLNVLSYRSKEVGTDGLTNCCSEHDVQRFPSSKILGVQGISGPSSYIYALPCRGGHTGVDQYYGRERTFTCGPQAGLGGSSFASMSVDTSSALPRSERCFRGLRNRDLVVGAYCVICDTKLRNKDLIYGAYIDTAQRAIDAR